MILGKANLSEWANFRGFARRFNGWSARGGFTRDPYVLDFDPCGSSSGSAVAPAANLCAAAVGTETDGSIVCPAGNNLVVGLKPTVGLVSQDGIIPIAHSQDTAGPMARTVTDAAILLGAHAVAVRAGRRASRLPTRLHAVPAARRAARAPASASTGATSRTTTAASPTSSPWSRQALDVMADLGATLVDTDTGDPFAYFDAEFTVLLVRVQGADRRVPATLAHTSMRTLADLIAFNIAHCARGDEVLRPGALRAGRGDERRPDRPGLSRGPGALPAADRAEGIDAALARRRPRRDRGPELLVRSSAAAVAGYPNISVPIGLAGGQPAGCGCSGFLQEPTLLALAYDLEQEVQPRSAPQFLGSVPPEPPDAGICARVAPARQEALPERVAASARRRWLEQALPSAKRVRPGR